MVAPNASDELLVVGRPLSKKRITLDFSADIDVDKRDMKDLVAQDSTAGVEDERLNEAISKESELKWPGKAEGAAVARLRRELRRLDSDGSNED